MDKLLDNEAFVHGVAVGLNLYQSRIISAHRRKEPIKAGEELFFLQDGREKLEQMLNDVCR